MTRDHGGGLDAAITRYGGSRDTWIDLSTGINPVPYPVGELPRDVWTALPDAGAMEALLTAARSFWSVPEGADIVAAPGASALIARLPTLTPINGAAFIPGPTYNEHAAAIEASENWQLGKDPDTAEMHVYVHPNNPDGRIWTAADMGGRALTIIDESFCDVMPSQSHVSLTDKPGILVLKSFGKFWGLAGLRLGFAIASPETLAPSVVSGETRASLADLLGPWAVSGPALSVGARALSDLEWAETTRARLIEDSKRLDALTTGASAKLVGGTTLFRLYEVDDAAAWQDRLARHQFWSRIFPYNPRWLRLGLPAPDKWERVEAALR